MVDTQDKRESADLDRATQCLKEGRVVAIPTDTLYGLAADVFNPAAVDRVFAVKGRAADATARLLTVL